MAGKRQRPNGTWEFCFKRNGVLSRPVYITFDTEAEGDEYAKRVDSMLARGVVPIGLGGEAEKTLGVLIQMYEEMGAPSHDERAMLPVLLRAVGSMRIAKLTYAWAENWVNDLRAARKAPSTISKYVSRLGRVVDWAMRRELVSLTANPLRLLPKGFISAARGEEDAGKLYVGERSRVLEEAEEQAIRKALVKKEEHLIFDMALETAMRMAEMYTLEWRQIDLPRRTIFLERTKNGSRRQVPITSVLLKLLENWKTESGGASDFVFPMWWRGGGAKERRRLSCMLSHLFVARFARAGVENFHFHDLRHTATTRFYERTSMTDVKIASITGHKGFTMLRRYANIRASTLASELW